MKNYKSDEVEFRTMKAARAAGLRTKDEWIRRERLPDRSWRDGVIPRRDTDPILVKGTEFFRLDQCEEIISRAEAKRRDLLVPQNAVPVKTFHTNYFIRHIAFPGFRLSDCVPKQKREARQMEALRFRDFHNLTSGQDAFSRLKLPDLLSNFAPAAVNAIIDAFPGDPDNQAKALRWVLRGLLPDRAIRKVKTDLEVSENAKVRE